MAKSKHVFTGLNIRNANAIINFLNISVAQWNKCCVKKPELNGLSPLTIQTHFNQNKQKLGYSTDEWLKMCLSTPQLFEINADSLLTHCQENQKVLNIDFDKWKKLCKQEPGLLIYDHETLKKNMEANSTALGISFSEWRKACIARAPLLTYKPETLIRKLSAFITYVKDPKKLLQSIKNPSDQQKHTLTRFTGLYLQSDEVIAGFLQHPNNFVSSPERMAYAFAYLHNAMQDYKVRKDPYELLSYIDLSVEPNLQMHSLNACFNRSQGKPVTFHTLAGAPKRTVKKTLSNTIHSDFPGNSPKTDREIIQQFPCPLLKKLKALKQKQ